MTFAGIFPYGRSFEEYALMFSLTPQEKGLRILGVGDGPSSFNQEATNSGWQVVSVDPIYACSVEIIRTRCHAVLGRMIDSVSSSPRHWIWRIFDNREVLRIHRQKTLQSFLADFTSSGRGERYIAGALPHLPFRTHAFDLALCSHVLFSWADVLDFEFHVAATREMLRLAREVRIFPIRKLNFELAEYVDGVSEQLRREGYSVDARLMSTEPSISGTEQLIIRDPKCNSV